MKKTPFSHVVYVGCVMSVLLSLSLIAVHASDNKGFDFSPFFSYQSHEKEASLAVAVIRRAQPKVKVAGVSIQAATAGTVTADGPSGSSTNVNGTSNTGPTPTSTPSLTVVLPNGGETWVAGSTHTITWQSTGIPSNFDGVSAIYLYRDSSAILAMDVSVPGNPGTYSLTLASNLTAANDYRIRVSTCVNSANGLVCYGNPNYATDASNSTFTITSATSQCAQAGLRADIYGGPNHVCCAGLVLQGGICNTPTTYQYLNIAELNVTTLDSSVPTSRRVFWRADASAGIGQYRYSVSQTNLTTLPWREDGVVNGTATGNIFGSQLDLTNLTPGATYYIEVRKWLTDSVSGEHLYGASRSTSFIVAGASTSQCAQAGQRADEHGGVCCTGLLLEFGRCYAPGSYDLAVVSTEATSLGLKFNFCNNSDAVTSFPVKISIDSEIRTFDLAGLHPAHACQTHTWTYGVWGITKPDGSHYYNVQVSVDPNGTYHDTDLSNNTQGSSVLIPVPTSTPHGLDNAIQNNKDRAIDNKGQDRALSVLERNRDEYIKKLLERIDRLELRVGELEKGVVDREKNRETKTDSSLTNRLSGQLLIQPQEKGEVWYLDPNTKQKFYLQDGEGAYKALQAFGTGISEADFKNIDKVGKTLKGKVLLRVQAHGEAYYIDKDGKPQYLKDGNAAYEIMKKKALGISNTDLSKIPTGSLDSTNIISQ